MAIPTGGYVMPYAMRLVTAQGRLTEPDQVTATDPITVEPYDGGRPVTAAISTTAASIKRPVAGKAMARLSAMARPKVMALLRVMAGRAAYGAADHDRGEAPRYVPDVARQTGQYQATADYVRESHGTPNPMVTREPAAYAESHGYAEPPGYAGASPGYARVSGYGRVSGLWRPRQARRTDPYGQHDEYRGEYSGAYRGETQFLAAPPATSGALIRMRRRPGPGATTGPSRKGSPASRLSGQAGKDRAGDPGLGSGHRFLSGALSAPASAIRRWPATMLRQSLAQRT